MTSYYQVEDTVSGHLASAGVGPYFPRFSYLGR